MNWHDIEMAPTDGHHILLDLGDSIPDVPYVAVGSFISEEHGRELGEELSASGGWLIWTSDADWYCIGFREPHGWTEIPERLD